MQFKNFQKDISFTIENVTFHLKTITFGELLEFQEKLAKNEDTENNDAMIEYIVKCIAKIDNLETTDGTVIDFVNEDVIKSFPPDVITEIVDAMANAYSGANDSKKVIEI